uniref:Reverse transcriptase zinc-binding domain-containing protein n=1 Tax=Tanacetum cinerariifolium TaxID=118510 RepID=A0A6L2KR29_TANCI|nr:reverse transcriptase zinc-binding domain-containing protein [Tanacetum cinerariifolium]
MESSSENSVERELQQMQLEERQLHFNCMARFNELKTHLEFLHNTNSLPRRVYEIASQTFLKEETPFKKFFDSKEVNALDFTIKAGKSISKIIRDTNQKLIDKINFEQQYKCNNLVEEQNDNLVSSYFDSEEQNMQQLQPQGGSKKKMSIKWFRVLQGNNSFLLREDFISLNSIDEGAFERAFLQIFGKELSTVKRIFSHNMDNLEEQLTKEKLHDNDSKTALTKLMTPFQKFFYPDQTVFSSLVQALEASLVVTESSGTLFSNSMIIFSSLKNDNNNSDKESSNSERNDEDADIGPSYDSDTVYEEPHLSNDTFKNVFAYGKQCHEQPESIPDIYEIMSDNVLFSSLINNLKFDVEKCSKVNHEAQQANALLTNELERYKEKEKQFANDMAIESEYYKKIKILNDEISYLKSQAWEKDKTFAKENEKYNQYVQPLLKRKTELEKKNQEFLKRINDLDNKLQKAGQTNQTLQMLLPKEDNANMGKQGLGFESQNDDVNPSMLIKAKELAPCLYNISKMGKDELSDHKTSSKEELKCEAKKRLKVKQRKSTLSYHGFVYAET